MAMSLTFKPGQKVSFKFFSSLQIWVLSKQTEGFDSMKIVSCCEIQTCLLYRYLFRITFKLSECSTKILMARTNLNVSELGKQQINLILSRVELNGRFRRAYLVIMFLISFRQAVAPLTADESHLKMVA